MPSDAPIQTLAFIGLGRMDRPMAANLIAAGFDLRVADRRPEVVAAIASEGAIDCSTPTEAAIGADAVITMLPDGKDVRAVMLGPDGAAAAMEGGAILIDMSSSAPMGTRVLGQELDRLEIGMIDAPVSGGVAKAEAAALTIMAGGDAALVDAVRPVFTALGTQIFHTGALGSGHAIKALNNFVSAAGLTAACEGLLVAESFGIDSATLVDVLNASTGRNNSTEKKLKPQVLSGTFGSGFAMALMAKDLHTANDLATALGLPQAGMDRQNRLWSGALNTLGKSAEHTEIYRYLRDGVAAQVAGAA